MKKLPTVSVVLTSCERFDLLTQTLDSFLEMNTHAIDEFVIIEDSKREKELKQILVNKPSYFRYICNGQKIGQLHSIDKAYATVHSDYVFHMEDDWVFLEKGFIEKGLMILERYPQYLSVWLRNKEEIPAILDRNHYRIINNERYYIIKEQVLGFAPSLISLKNYKKVAPYAQFKKPIEINISTQYEALGFETLMTDKPLVKHIGWHRRVMNPEEKKRYSIQYMVDRWLRTIKAKIYQRFKLGKFRESN
ncbi:MAG: glycosyltransferase [bacterium]